MLRDAFGNLRPVRSAIINIAGLISAVELRVLNHMRIAGVEHLERLPSQGVLLVSNHHTHYMDAIAVLHTICYLKRPYLVWPRTNFYYVAALETMRQSGLLAKVMAYNGAICVKRTWKDKRGATSRPVDPKDVENIGKGLGDGWVLTYPQGTTKPGARGRIGVAHIIKRFRPLVVPVRIEGFREAFDKTGLALRKLGSRLSVTYGPPLDIDADQAPEAILDQVMAGIGEK